VTTQRRRLPDYAANGPLYLVLRHMGLDGNDPRDVLLAAVYQLAARLERRTPPWDAEGRDLVGSQHRAQLPAGRCSIKLQAHVGPYADGVPAYVSTGGAA